MQGKGEVRSQFHHVIDVAKTILEVAGLPEPEFVNGIQQAPLEGASMAESFNDAGAPENHRCSTSRSWAIAASTSRLDRVHAPPRPLEGRHAAAVRSGRLGTLRARRLDASQ